MELVDPTRSKVDGDGVTSNATLGFEDAVKDLKCCVTSLQTLKATVDSHVGVILWGTILSSTAASEKKQSAVKRGSGKIIRVGKACSEGHHENVILSGGSEGTVLSGVARFLGEAAACRKARKRLGTWAWKRWNCSVRGHL